MANKETVPNLADITLYENSILEMRFHKTAIDLNAAKQITDTASKLSRDVVHANLVDIRDMFFMSGDARKHFGSQDKSTVKAVAIVAHHKKWWIIFINNWLLKCNIHVGTPGYHCSLFFITIWTLHQPVMLYNLFLSSTPHRAHQDLLSEK